LRDSETRPRAGWTVHIFTAGMVGGSIVECRCREEGYWVVRRPALVYLEGQAWKWKWGASTDASLHHSMPLNEQYKSNKTTTITWK
jgi:hypothetical protein